MKSDPPSSRLRGTTARRAHIRPTVPGLRRGRGERLIEFPEGRVVIFFDFILLFFEDELMNFPACAGLSSSARNQEPFLTGAFNSGLTSVDSGLQLDLEIA